MQCPSFNITKSFGGGMHLLVKETSFIVHDPALRACFEETLVDSVLAAAKGCDQNTIEILLEASGQQLMRITAAKCESSQGYHE